MDSLIRTVVDEYFQERDIREKVRLACQIAGCIFEESSINLTVPICYIMLDSPGQKYLGWIIPHLTGCIANTTEKYPSFPPKGVEFGNLTPLCFG